ncbi:MAG: hypothetical protein IV100_25375 [Myxococcales bacterium]|nr:hypothetical protein [Myxococcales bacterium]
MSPPKSSGYSIPWVRSPQVQHAANASAAADGRVNDLFEQVPEADAFRRRVREDPTPYLLYPAEQFTLIQGVFVTITHRDAGGERALAHQSYQLAFNTSSLEALADKIPSVDLSSTLSAAGYMTVDAAGEALGDGWWAPAGLAHPDIDAFYQPNRFESAAAARNTGNLPGVLESSVTEVDFDAAKLFVTEVRSRYGTSPAPASEPLWNVVSAEIDYHRGGTGHREQGEERPWHTVFEAAARNRKEGT